MDATGSWKVTAATPAGPQVMDLHIVMQGVHFTGRIESAMGNLAVEGTAEGDTLRWVSSITKPMSMKVTFELTVSGDTLNGIAKLGFLGKAKLTGERIASEAIPAPTESAAKAALPSPLTEDFTDPQFNEPYIEVSELRTHPVPHRYVHGGFKGTDARFSFYFPPKERYQGRFFHNTYPMATSSDIGPFPIAFEVATGNLGFTIDSGAYYVQTNLGGRDRAPPADPAIAAYRVNAAAAKYSRVVAADLFGSHRPYGYLFGGSGGSYQTIGASENTAGIWDGFVPFVMGGTNAIPSMFTVRMHALRVLRARNRLPGIADAMNPGGSGDPYAGLNQEEAAALKEVSLMGYPLRGWYNHEALTSGYFYNVAPLMPMLDPTYVDDFWSKPGYLGSDPAAAIRKERFQFDTTVAEVIEGHPRQLRLASVPERDFADAHLVLLSGAGAGQSIPIASIRETTIGFAFAANQAVINGIQPGDQVGIDNSWVLALQTYHRHQVPTPDMYGWNQFRSDDGTPLYPQRDVMIGPIGAAGTAGSIADGHIHGKMLLLGCLMDIDALPWQADWYRSKVQDALEADFDDRFAIWFIDHAHHDDPATPKARAHAVSYSGALQQALRDVSKWVEKGIRPADTRYQVRESQVEVPAAAADRRGIQPTVELKANGGVRADVRPGEPVSFTGTIEVPPNAGQVVATEWDFEGTGDYPSAQQIDTPRPFVQISASYTYSKPGTYLAVLRATSQREGNPHSAYGRVQNIARVRVVVS
jgi:hypothetical protein